MVDFAAHDEPVGDAEPANAPDPADSEASAVEVAFAAPAGATWCRVDSVLAWYRRILLAATVLPLGIVGAGAALLWSGPVSAVLWALAAVILLAAGWYAARRVQRSWGYAEGRADFYITSGVVVRQLVVIPYGRMQLVDVTSNVLEQLLGIATVRVRTAATIADARISGLRFDDAIALRDRLAARSETFSTGL
ncbi:PH domain-containing protein [Salinactinospora qingdaonensis]|uniref:PH domain-containing protein n=1 Tax=Salinactinospora qingdaonensis TaxID=702744 RepID=UPI003CD09BDD